MYIWTSKYKRIWSIDLKMGILIIVSIICSHYTVVQSYSYIIRQLCKWNHWFIDTISSINLDLRLLWTNTIYKISIDFCFRWKCRSSLRFLIGWRLSWSWRRDSCPATYCHIESSLNRKSISSLSRGQLNRTNKMIVSILLTRKILISYCCLREDGYFSRV